MATAVTTGHLPRARILVLASGRRIGCAEFGDPARPAGDRAAWDTRLATDVRAVGSAPPASGDCGSSRPSGRAMDFPTYRRLPEPCAISRGHSRGRRRATASTASRSSESRAAALSRSPPRRPIRTASSCSPLAGPVGPIADHRRQIRLSSGCTTSSSGAWPDGQLGPRAFFRSLRQLVFKAPDTAYRGLNAAGAAFRPRRFWRATT